MSGIATKAANSVFYKARMEAKEENEMLSSREGAAEVLGIDRTRLARIELGTLTPYPEEAVLMADAYNAPNLMNHFCTAECPIGKRIMMQADLEQLDKMAIDILAAVHGVANVSDAVLTIVADGRVSGEEMVELQKVLENMQQVAKAASELQIYISKAKGCVRKL